MRMGELNNLTTIQIKTVTYDAYGAPIETWADSFNEWAKIEENGSGEFYAAQKLYATTSAVFTYHYTTRITSTNRIKWGTRIFEILGAPRDKDGKRAEMLITAKEVL